MPAIPWLRRLFRPAPAGRRRPTQRRLAVEELECRAVPAALTYGGGPVLANVSVETIFYGKDWSTNSALQAEAQQIDSYFQFLTGSSVVDLLAQYSTPTQTIGHGSFLDGRILPATLGTSVDDNQIQAMLGNAIAGGQVQAPDANRLYFVFVEPGVVVTLQGQDSVINFLGYHNAFADAAGAPAYYAVIPYQTSPNASIGGISEFQSLTTVASHEFAEAVTDPDTQTGWRDYTSTGDEIGDLATQLPPVYLNGYAVQELYSDQAGGNVAPAGATAAPPGQGTTPSGDLSAAGQDVLATVDQPFSGVVALVSTGDPSAPGDLVASIDWGDGSAPDTVALVGPDANGYFEVAGSHVYLGSGVGTISVTVEDTATGALTQTASTVGVQDAGVNLSVAGQHLSATEGQPFTGVVALVSAADPNAPADLTATIDWGDGSFPDTVLLSGPDASGYYEVVGSHVYQGTGTATVTVTVQDLLTGDAAQASAMASVQGAVGSGLGVAAEPVNAVVGQRFTGVVALVKDSNPAVTADDLEAAIYWGDGRRTLVLLTGPDANGYFEVVGSHTYRGTGTGTVQVLVLDQTTGAEALGSSTVQVTTQPPPTPPATPPATPSSPATPTPVPPAPEPEIPPVLDPLPPVHHHHARHHRARRQPGKHHHASGTAALPGQGE